MTKILTHHPINKITKQKFAANKINKSKILIEKIKLPEILFISSFPPRECGIATYSEDLLKALNNKFQQTFSLTVCPLESEFEQHTYDTTPQYILNTSIQKSFVKLAFQINKNSNIKIVVIQHEFGFFANCENDFQYLLNTITKPLILVFHTVLPRPDSLLRLKVQEMCSAVDDVVIMTKTASKILKTDYEISPAKITVIPHGTHLVPHLDKAVLKQNYEFSNKTILSTFGLLSKGKSIETTLNALPKVIAVYPNILFLIIGKTHPTVKIKEGEQYRDMLEEKVVSMGLQNNVKFINKYVPLPELLEYLQLTDLYLFTSNDPNQAVSGTFSYAISCGCPVISTPIPHANEVLKNDAGLIFDFGNSEQLAAAIIKLLDDEQLRKIISSNGLHKMASTAWENSAISHAMLFEKICPQNILLNYHLPEINLGHIKKMTTDFGIIQFSIINSPDIHSGYTLDDNARALIAFCQHYMVTGDHNDLFFIKIYYDFIKFCFKSNGTFLNYVNEAKEFTAQNELENLEDSNGRALWALGFMISHKEILPASLINDATNFIQLVLHNIHIIHSTRAMAFSIKGLYYLNSVMPSENNIELIRLLSDRIVQMYKHEAIDQWRWYESYLTYGNSILPEAMLCAWKATNEIKYKEIAKSSFDFLLSKIFNKKGIKVISNQGWLHRGNSQNESLKGGEQPIDVAYTIMALEFFANDFPSEDYLNKIVIAFNWFLGSNHLHQIIYNPCTGGCYDGLEGKYVNLNQGAESSLSYLMARLTIEKLINAQEKTFYIQSLSRSLVITD